MVACPFLWCIMFTFYACIKRTLCFTPLPAFKQPNGVTPTPLRSGEFIDQDVDCDSTFVAPEDTTTVMTDHERVAHGLRICLSDLSSENDSVSTASSLDIESMAHLIYESMSGPSRIFHSTDHIFDISEGADSIQTLAAFFHDVVYYAIDGGLSEAQETILNDVIVINATDENTEIKIAESESFARGGESEDAIVAMVLAVFDFTPGQTLDPFNGLNEFLSAVICARTLADKVAPQQLFRIAACVEATIPFRGNVGDVLFHRLVTANTEFRYQMTLEQLVECTQAAVGLANRDVANFAHDPELFLSNSWNLMPETNVPLRENTWGDREIDDNFKVSDFASAVDKMRVFFHYLNPDLVFNSFRGCPDDETFEELNSRVRENLNIARKYMNGKMLCSAFLGAVAELTGGETTVAFWRDGKNSTVATKTTFVNGNNNSNDSMFVPTMPEFKVHKGVNADKKVFSLLNKSIDTEMGTIDINQTALAPLLYGMMGDERAVKVLENIVVPMDAENARNYLDSLPKEALVPLLFCLSCTCNDRSEELKKLMAEYDR